MEELINYQRFTNRKWLTIILCVLGGHLGWVHWYNGNSNKAWRNWLCAVIGGLFTFGCIPTIMWSWTMCTTFWRILDAQTLEELYNVSDMTLEDVEKKNRGLRNSNKDSKVETAITGK